MNDFPEPVVPKPLWLMTLADLALLLLGFMLLVQATAAPKREELSRSLRDAFAPSEPPLMPVTSFAVRFGTGSAAIADPAPLIAWARENVRDPRVELTVTAAVDGSAADTGPGGPALLALDRARAVAQLLSGVVPPRRLRLSTDPRPRGRTATVTLAFAGERP
ncbi:hypothetical protein [Sphingomonas lenta]|nr:hypothetical protein [Sphingomonas lenta]